MNKLKKLYRWTLFFLGVPTCLGCRERLEKPFLPLCPTCLEKYWEIKTSDCSLCAKPLPRCSCANEYLRAHFVKSHFKLFRYINRPENDAANALVYSLKRDNRADVLDFLTEELHGSLADFLAENPDAVFTNIPRRRSAIIEYGIDHAKDLAKRLAKRSGHEYRALLVSKSKAEQKTRRGKERIDNVIFDIKGKKTSLRGKTVIIVDDIVTTGASMATAGALLRSLGAKKIVAASVAVTYKDAPSPLDLALYK